MSMIPLASLFSINYRACFQWAEAKVVQNTTAGMFASEVRLMESGKLDSAGMLIAADGSSRQRGHGELSEGQADTDGRASTMRN